MNKNKISIAAITWARNNQEEELLRESLQQLASLDIPVYIADGGSGKGFLDFLGSFHNFHIVEFAGKGVWAQASSSVLAAYDSGADFIFYTEPDKTDFFNKFFVKFITNAPDDEPAGIILAARSEAGFATFPAFQRNTETVINNCCQEITGKSCDYTYGPFLLNRKLVPYLQLLQEDTGWGWRPFLFGIAHRLGYNIVPIIDDFECPLPQRKDNAQERIYRMRQLTQNIQGLVLSTGVKLPE